MKTLRIFLGILFVSLIAGTAAQAGVHPAASIPGILALITFGGGGLAGVHQASAIDYTNLAAALGAYSRKENDTIMSELMVGMDIDDRITVFEGIEDEFPLIKMITGDLVKPGGDPTTFAATAGAFTPDVRMLKVRPWKIDLTFYPQLMERQYHAYLRGAKISPAELPFAAFFFAEVTKKANENLRLKSLFNGVYNAVGTTPVAVHDGYLKIIADAVTATTITPVVTGAVTLATIIDDVEEVYDALDEAAKGEQGQILVSPTLFTWYGRKYRSLHGQNMNYTGINKDEVLIEGTSYTLKKEPGMTTSQRIIATTKANMAYGASQDANSAGIIVQNNKRGIDVMVDAKAGAQFASISRKALAVNDQS